MREILFQIGSLLLIIVGTFATAFPEWFRMTDYDGLFGSKLMVRKGLWLKCIRNQPGKGSHQKVYPKSRDVLMNFQKNSVPKFNDLRIRENPQKACTTVMLI